jgi:hypothetical protein
MIKPGVKMEEKKKKYCRRALPEIKKHLKAQVNGGKSISRFCKDKNLPIGTFNSWRKKYSHILSSPQFVKVNTEGINPHGFEGSIEVTTPKGYSIKIEQSGNQTSLKNILKTIKGLSL